MKLSFSPFMVLQDGQFWITHPTPAGWAHIVLNYIGPYNGERITLHINGEEVKSDTTKYGGSYSAGDGRIVVGREYTDKDDRYSSVQIDELVFFNHHLSSAEIAALVTAY